MRLSPRGTAALLAVIGFVALILVPQIKYPAKPPAIGDPATIGLQTELYFTMIALSSTTDGTFSASPATENSDVWFGRCS